MSDIDESGGKRSPLAIVLAVVGGLVVLTGLLCVGGLVGLTLLGQSLESRFEAVADEVEAGP